MGGFVVVKEKFLDLLVKFVVGEGVSELFVESIVDVLAKVVVSDDVVDVFDDVVVVS